jgi:hybrid cluster-associated redox disulfide protein
MRVNRDETPRMQVHRQQHIFRSLGFVRNAAVRKSLAQVNVADRNTYGRSGRGCCGATFSQVVRAKVASSRTEAVMPFAKDLENSDLALSDLMTRWPETIGVFLGHRMLCVGCMIGPFHTVVDACDEYRLDEDVIRRDLAAAIRAALAPRS